MTIDSIPRYEFSTKSDFRKSSDCLQKQERCLQPASKHCYYPQRAQRAGGIVRVWQIFGHGYDFTTWSELGTKSRVKVTYFNGKKYLKEFKKYL